AESAVGCAAGAAIICPAGGAGARAERRTLYAGATGAGLYYHCGGKYGGGGEKNLGAARLRYPRLCAERLWRRRCSAGLCGGAGAGYEARVSASAGRGVIGLWYWSGRGALVGRRSGIAAVRPAGKRSGEAGVRALVSARYVSVTGTEYPPRLAALRRQ